MNAKKCDRCGKLYEMYEGKVIFPYSSQANSVTLFDETNRYNVMARKCYDLCPECMTRLVAFLDGMGNREG